MTILLSCKACSDFAEHMLVFLKILLLTSGKETAKKYYESIKTVDKDGNRRKLIKWIQGKCKEIGNQMVGHKIRVWWPADNNGIGVYHTGTVASFDDQWADHHINYDDDDGEDLWLAVESWTDLGEDICNCACCLRISCFVCQLYSLAFLHTCAFSMFATQPETLQTVSPVNITPHGKSLHGCCRPGPSMGSATSTICWTGQPVCECLC